MKLIVITPPYFFSQEACIIAGLLERGADRIHLRKPGSDVEGMTRLIEAIPRRLRQHLTLHDHFHLALRYGVGGIHLNSRNPLPPKDYRGLLSCSCHSTEEVTRHKPMADYLFLSPIFDSLSKEGYQAAFAEEELDWAMRAGIIDCKVMALGGVTAQHVPQLRQWNFGGMAMLGGVWQDFHDGDDASEVYRRFDDVRRMVSA